MNKDLQLVLEHLMYEGYADNYNSAAKIINSMSNEWRDEVIEEGLRSYLRKKINIYAQKHDIHPAPGWIKYNRFSRVTLPVLKHGIKRLLPKRRRAEPRPIQPRISHSVRPSDIDPESANIYEKSKKPKYFYRTS